MQLPPMVGRDDTIRRSGGRDAAVVRWRSRSSRSPETEWPCTAWTRSMTDRRFPDVPSGYPFPALEQRGARALARGADLREVPGEAGPRGRVRVLRRARRPPTTCRTSATCRPGWPRTSSPATAPCAATTWPARRAGTPTACRWRSRSRSASASRASRRSRSTASPSSTAPAWRACTTYEREWRAMTERLGYWTDLDHAYFTFSNQYIESVWWALARALADAACWPRATRSSPTAPAAAPPCRATRWRRTTRTSRTRRSGRSSRPARGRA